MTDYRDSTIGTSRCVTCGVPLGDPSSPCGYCGAQAGSTLQTAPPGRSIPDAIDLWGRSMWGAPRNLSRLVTKVEVQDDLVERLYTEIVRREVGWELAPGQGQATASPLQPEQVDPFAVTLAQLRQKSEHTITCRPCNGDGAVACGGCHGTGRTPCYECRGSGQVLRQYKKSSRWIHCPTCRGKQTLACGQCNRTGRVVCAGCVGSRRQRAWLVYTEVVHKDLRLAPPDSIHARDPQLAQYGAIGGNDLARFGVLVDRTCQDPDGLPRTDEIDTPFVRSVRPQLQPKRDRVRLQQYQRLVVVRRQVTYEMAGTSGTLAFTGSDGMAAPRAASSLPIERRRWVWGTLGAALGVGAVFMHGHAVGKAAYFDSLRGLLVGLYALGLFLLLPAVGAVLREWRPGFRFGKLHRLELAAGVLGLVVVNSATAFAMTSQPRLAEVNAAIGAGDLGRAKQVVEAMEEVNARGRDTTTAQDVYAMAAVSKSPLQERLELLDGVAARGQVGAPIAAKRARDERVAELNRMVASGAAAAANTTLLKWFPAWEADSELRGVRARASEAEATTCGEDRLCTLVATRNAARAEATPGRTQAEATARQAVEATLAFSEILGEPGTARLKRLKAAAELADRVPKLAPDEVALVATAKSTAASVGAERAKVALIGSDIATAAELVGKLSPRPEGASAIALEGGGNVYLAMDGTGVCRGVYATGDPGKRALQSAVWTPNRILSQAIGKPAFVQQTRDPLGTARWIEGGTPVVARWKDGAVVELRIGADGPLAVATSTVRRHTRIVPATSVRLPPAHPERPGHAPARGHRRIPLQVFCNRSARPYRRRVFARPRARCLSTMVGLSERRTPISRVE